MTAQLRSLIQHEATYEYLELDTLHTDPRYQRAVSTAKVREIAQHFNERAVGVLTISERANGERVVLDGQHRRDAMKLKNRTVGLCEVYRGLTLEEEAQIFIAKNSVRKNPEAIDVFRARLIAGDEKALLLKSIVEDFGLFIIVHNAGSHKRVPKGIYAVRALEEIYDTRGEDMLRLVLSIICQAWPDDYLALEHKVLLAIAAFCHTYKDLYDSHDLIRKLGMTSIKSLVVRAQANADLAGGTAMRHFARAMVEVYNKGKRNNRLDMEKI